MRKQWIPGRLSPPTRPGNEANVHGESSLDDDIGDSQLVTLYLPTSGVRRSGMDDTETRKQ